LAARLGGMTQHNAQKLAGYCHGMTQMNIGSGAVSPWYYQGKKFTPCVTGSSVANDDLGVYHSELAFRCLPAFEAPEPAVVSRDIVDTRHASTRANAGASGGVEAAMQPAQHAYNPLTDIDWKDGGKMKPSFGQKLAAKLERLVRQPSLRDNVHGAVQGAVKGVVNDAGQRRDDWSEPSANLDPDAHQQITGLDPRLKCQANSPFARQMMNDSLNKTHYDNKTSGIEMALLGCRLFVYQNTWGNGDKKAGINPPPTVRARKLVEAFYWTLYTIESFMRGKTLRDKLHLSWQKHATNPALLDNTLYRLLSFKGDTLEREFMWLNQLPGLLGHYGLSQKSVPDNWWEGFRCRPDHLLEQAMIASGAGLGRDIQIIESFRQSDFFKLNKACEYHANWLYLQLKQRKLAFYSTAQQCGDDVAFQL
ncbi:MAG: hypothetical protein MJK04_27635, partial [Psychrosphaera sp.]|nr:hypothetical protein [Psychrosphaera sp.]